MYASVAGLRRIGRDRCASGDQFGVLLLGLLRPVPGVIERFELRLRIVARLVLEQDVVRPVRVEWWVQVHEIDRLARHVLAENVKVVAVEQLIPARDRTSHPGEGRSRPGFRAAMVNSPATAGSLTTSLTTPVRPLPQRRRRVKTSDASDHLTVGSGSQVTLDQALTGEDIPHVVVEAVLERPVARQFREGVGQHAHSG